MMYKIYFKILIKFCKVATDAIGMGLNLNIRRIIFASTVRQGKLLPTYSALQIAGRAGR